MEIFATEEKKKRRNYRKERTHWKINERQNNKIYQETLFEQQHENCYKPKKVSNFWNNNYLEYESNGDKNRNLSRDVYLNKTEPYMRNTIIDLQNYDTW